jgi:formylmethanofuran dehydrogenase subunit E
MFYTNDPVADFHRWDDEREERLLKLPCCEKCGEHIQQEDAVRLGDEWYCDECLKEARKTIEVDW